MRTTNAISTGMILVAVSLSVVNSSCESHDASTGGGGSHPGSTGAGGRASGSTSPSVVGDAGAPIHSEAADLRTTLNLLLGEHQILAAKATGAALGARTAEYAAYANLLNQNGTAIGSVIAAALGAPAGAQFNALWSAHDGFFVAYTTAVAAKDPTKQQQAVDSLTNTYVPQFAAFISDATGLPQATVATLTQEHVMHTKAIVDDQAAANWATAYADIRTAFAHVQQLADPVSEAIAGKLSTEFPGDPANKGVDFRVALNKLLQEHMFLATFATGAALGGRTDEFGAAGTALNSNGTDIGAALGVLFGSPAQSSFNGIWSAHDGFFVDYTTGVATNDTTEQTQAVNNLLTVFVPKFAAFISGATGLDNATVASLTKDHVVHTKAVVDAQGAGDSAGAATDDLEAAQHMPMIADPLATAIVAKLPTKFE